jgi:hypothetical protein
MLALARPAVASLTLAQRQVLEADGG